jgi:hypothetical protein
MPPDFKRLGDLPMRPNLAASSCLTLAASIEIGATLVESRLFEPHRHPSKQLTLLRQRISVPFQGTF